MSGDRCRGLPHGYGEKEQLYRENGIWLEKRQLTSGEASLLAGFLSSGSTTGNSSLLKSTSFELLGTMTEILLAELGESGSLSDLVRVVMAGMSEDVGD
jgi:hypothetical protein